MINIAKRNEEMWKIIDSDHIICVESDSDIIIRLRDRISVRIPKSDVKRTVITRSKPISPNVMDKEAQWFRCLISVLENARMKGGFD